jgi:hypothetical protein
MMLWWVVPIDCLNSQFETVVTKNLDEIIFESETTEHQYTFEMAMVSNSTKVFVSHIVSNFFIII